MTAWLYLSRSFFYYSFLFTRNCILLNSSTVSEGYNRKTLVYICVKCSYSWWYVVRQSLPKFDRICKHQWARKKENNYLCTEYVVPPKVQYNIWYSNTWKQNFIEVSGRNRESSQTWSSVRISLTTGKGVWFLSGFPPFSYTVYSDWTGETVRGCVSLKKQKSQGKAVEVTVNSKEENS